MGDIALLKEWVGIGGAVVGILMAFLVPWWGHRREMRRYEREARPDAAPAHAFEAAATAMSSVHTVESLRLQNEALGKMAVMLDRLARAEESRNTSDKRGRQRFAKLVAELTVLIRRLDQALSRLEVERAARIESAQKQEPPYPA